MKHKLKFNDNAFAQNVISNHTQHLAELTDLTRALLQEGTYYTF